jgi:transposase
MNLPENKTVYCGIDVSKSTFDTYLKSRSHVFENDLIGFKKLVQLLPINAHCVMEATGPYYLKLAVYLQSHGLKVSVVNPLVIKRFSQMRMLKAKTDKADARLITHYAEKENPKQCEAPKPVLIQIQQEQAVLNGLNKQLRMLKNQMESITVQPFQSGEALKALKTVIDEIERQALNIDCSILRKVEMAFSNEVKLITSIPGIGIKTAIALLVTTNGFSSFDSGKQVASFIGICPRIYQSGTSIKSKGHITKMGDVRTRSLLYMCACSAKKYNTACQKLYDRLVENGKAKKLALIAVANKLVKQAYAVVIKKEMYNPEYYFALNRN